MYVCMCIYVHIQVSVYNISYVYVSVYMCVIHKYICMWNLLSRIELTLVTLTCDFDCPLKF